MLWDVLREAGLVALGGFVWSIALLWADWRGRTQTLKQWAEQHATAAKHLETLKPGTLLVVPESPDVVEGLPLPGQGWVSESEYEKATKTVEQAGQVILGGMGKVIEQQQKPPLYFQSIGASSLPAAPWIVQPQGEIKLSFSTTATTYAILPASQAPWCIVGSISGVIPMQHLETFVPPPPKPATVPPVVPVTMRRRLRPS